ncbi:putative flippase GtrA [Arcanobacterium wilhelmae]|uniref:Flippase GtrA n=1 Tax=Arcanobacterium wilhelmae TaxID=1803177 RepID=A0ABT9NDB5_9ACTO|nr:GtrA family protein [Arcanobacterium wilhelmae]MDP9801713.1 putative flippase GtrA [Arcanobacterium wilhelmae]
MVDPQRDRSDRGRASSEFGAIVRYIVSAGISFVLDVVLFAVFQIALQAVMGRYSILVATVLARAISSFVNFLLNSYFVFKSQKKNAIYQYYALVVTQMTVSALAVYLLSFVFAVAPVAIKIPVEIVIFCANYLIQRFVIFSK